MNRTAHRLFFFALFITFAGLAGASNFAYLSDYETTELGDHIYWRAPDTLTGPIHTNSQFAIWGSPVFYDVVSQVSEGFFMGPAYSPQFLGPPPVFNTLVLSIPDHAGDLRLRAMVYGTFFDHGSYDQARVRIEHDHLLVWWGTVGEPVDTMGQPDTVQFSPPHPVVWFECPIHVAGILESTLILCSSDQVGLEDNILYVSSNPQTGALSANHTEKFALVSEGDIKVLNTQANGREDSNFMGPNQPNASLTDIAINGFLFALGGSFTFEQQNLADSSYVCVPCGCTPVPGGSPPPNCGTGGRDERGTIYLWGGLTQRRRGYTHRSCCGGTGYDYHFRYDIQLANWNIGVWPTPGPSEQDTIYFGNVPIGETARDTVRIGYPGYLGAVITNWPFDAERIDPFFGSQFRVPVSFTPSQATHYSGMLLVFVSSQLFQIPLDGYGISGGAPPLAEPDVYPNPFNVSTSLRFELAETGHVTAELFDVTGRRVALLTNQDCDAGKHQVRIDGTGLASGVYFVQLNTAEQVKSMKLLLLK